MRHEVGIRWAQLCLHVAASARGASEVLIKGLGFAQRGYTANDAERAVGAGSAAGDSIPPAAKKG
jgi:hypothetical protein